MTKEPKLVTWGGLAMALVTVVVLLGGVAGGAWDTSNKAAAARALQQRDIEDLKTQNSELRGALKVLTDADGRTTRAITELTVTVRDLKDYLTARNR